MAMAALGLTTRFGALKQAGVKPLLLGLLMFIWLILGGGALNAGATFHGVSASAIMGVLHQQSPIQESGMKYIGAHVSASGGVDRSDPGP